MCILFQAHNKKREHHLVKVRQLWIPRFQILNSRWESQAKHFSCNCFMCQETPHAPHTDCITQSIDHCLRCLVHELFDRKWFKLPYSKGLRNLSCIVPSLSNWSKKETQAIHFASIQTLVGQGTICATSRAPLRSSTSTCRSKLKQFGSLLVLAEACVMPVQKGSRCQASKFKGSRYVQRQLMKLHGDMAFPASGS